MENKRARCRRDRALEEKKRNDSEQNKIERVRKNTKGNNGENRKLKLK